jgi:hypothetical protein
MAEGLSLSLASDANLKAYYKLESTADTGPNNYTLTNNGTVTFSAGKYNNAANFGSSNSAKYLSTTNPMGITTGALSISLWVKMLAEINTGGYALAAHSNTDKTVESIVTYQYNSGTRRFRFSRFKPPATSDAVNYEVDAGTANFYHLVYSYDGTNLSAYVNGALAGSTAASGTGTGGPDTGVYIGRDAYVASYSSALIDDVMIFNRGLTSGEASSLYADGSPLFFAQL